MGIIKTEHFENLDELDTEIGRHRLPANYYTRFLKMKNLLPIFWMITLIIFIAYNVILDGKMLSSQNNNNVFLSKLLLEKMGSKLKIDVVEENITDTVIEYEEYNE